MYTNKGAMANLQEQKVQEWTADYITALNDNFYNHQVDSYQRMVREGKYTDHALDQLRNIKTRDARYLYTWKALSGRKMFKVVYQTFDEDENRFRNGSVHAFIDKKTGEVYKAASWQNPAKHVRYDMRIIKDREFLHNPENIDWAGGHLYMR